MMLHPELLRAARTARRPLGLATVLLAAVTLTHLAQAVLLAVVLSRIAHGDTAALAPLLLAVLAVVLISLGVPIAWPGAFTHVQAG